MVITTLIHLYFHIKFKQLFFHQGLFTEVIAEHLSESIKHYASIIKQFLRFYKILQKNRILTIIFIVLSSFAFFIKIKIL